MPASLTFATAALIVLPLLAILILNIVNRQVGQKIALNVALVVTVIQMIAVLICGSLLVTGGKGSIDFSVFWNMNANLSASFFTVDFFSIVVLFSIGMVAFISAMVAKRGVNGKELNFTNLLMVILLGMNGIAMVGDLFSLYVFLEITGICSFVMIALYHSKEGLEGAFKYLLMSSVATAFLLIAMAFLFMQVGSLKFADLTIALSGWATGEGDIFITIAFICFIAGVAVKTGLMPFHSWMPDAYQSAPAAVSVLLGGIVSKVCGVYIVIRVLSSFFANIPEVAIAVGLLAIISICFGAIAAYAQNDFKRILAYSSISQIGYIALGIAAGGPLGFIGAMLHFFNHATFKTTLFVDSAILEESVGTTDIEQMGGLERQLPVANVTTILSLLSTSGIPPLAGFWSKALIIIAVWQAGFHFTAGIAIFASVFTLVYFLRLQRKVFFGPAVDHLSEVKESRGTLAFSAIALSVVTIGVGVLFPLILRFLQAQGLL